MITEDYISFETAKLLKEKEFNEPTLAYVYGQDMISYYSRPRVTDPLSIEAGRIPLPTLQMAMKWLREVHNLFICVEFDPLIFSADIYKMDEIDEHGGAKHIPPTFANAKSYESACGTAIKYCLENLI